MPSKFYTLASKILPAALCLATAHAQTPASSSTPKAGYIRFWDMLPASNGSFQMLQSDKPKEGPLATAAPYRYSSYTEFPAGKYRLAITKKGETTPLKAFDLDLKQDTYFTILVSPRSIEMSEDTEDAKATSGTLTIRNFFPGSMVSASIGQTQIVGSLPYGQSYQATALPLGRVSITLRGKLSNGKSAESSADVDFKTGKRATALVIPDSYERFRPRVTFDGKNL